MIEFTPREIQTFSKENSDKIGKKEKEGQKVDEKVDFSIELEKSGQELRREKVVRPKGNEKMIVIDDGSEYCEIEGQKVDEKVDFPIESEKNERELPREKVVRPKGNEKMIVIDDGSEYCETEGRKMEDKDQGGIGRNRKKPGRIKKVITVEDGPAFCKKKWKQTAASDPDNTKQTSSSGSRPRRIEDSICITDPEHLKKNVGKRVSYEQRKENQSRKQYSLRSKAKEQKEKSDIGSSETPSMSSRKPTSTMETNEISVCAKSVSPDMKAPTEQTRNQHGNSDNNYMGSIVDQAVNNYMIVLVINQLITTWVVLVINQLITTWVVLVINQLITTWVVLVINQLITTWVVLLTKQLMSTRLVLAAKQIIFIITMVLTSGEVVKIKQITSIATSVATRVPDRTNVVIVVTWITWVNTFTTESINNMGKGQQIFSISSIQQQFHRFMHLIFFLFQDTSM